MSAAVCSNPQWFEVRSTTCFAVSDRAEPLASIEYLERTVLYENPRPHVHSRHGYFPGIVRLASGDLLALFVIAEAFEAPNSTTYVSRSKDFGKTWHLEGPLYDKSALGFETSDSLKATALRDGSVIAIGYRFRRDNIEQGISLPETEGILNGDNIVAFSIDRGKSWSTPQILPRSSPELLECSGPCLQLQSGDLVETAAFFKLPNGTNPSGQTGVLLRSTDQGKTWTDHERFYSQGTIVPYESRVCEMDPGHLVVMIWAYHYAGRKNLANQVVVSHDNGYSWSQPIDTGIFGQASNLLWLGGTLLASIHAHREREVGIYLRIVDFKNDSWQLIRETMIYGVGARAQTIEGKTMSEMFASLRFGQPSLLRIRDDNVLAYHWAIEDGQGKILQHRLRLCL